jgi:DNA-binding NarL/FixJ family response regulator
MPGAMGRSREGALKKITVLVADDHAPLRLVIGKLLGKDGHFEVVGQARNGQEAVKMARTLRPDVILMDLAMPVLTGMEATRQILGGNPKAKVLILSVHDDDEYIAHAISLGALGFLSKSTDTKFLAEAIREVAKGNWFFSPAIAERMANARK